MSENIFASGSMTSGEERSERARRAVRAFRAMQPGLTGYARAITGRKDVVVELAQGTPRTDGRKIMYKPPIELGDLTPHERAKCERRDPRTLLQLCAACKAREAVLAAIYHEIGHIHFGTFAEVKGEVVAGVLDQALTVTGGKYAKTLKENWDRVPDWKKKDYLNLSSLISPYLPILVNALEDARVDEAMFRARKGMRVMFDALMMEIFREGIPLEDGSHDLWSSRPLNSQALIGVFVLATGYNFEGWFDPIVESALKDDQLQSLVKQIDTVRSAEGTYGLAFPILARLRELGFCKADEDPEDEPEEEQEPEENPQEEEENEDGQEEGPEGDSEDDQPGGDDPSGESVSADRDGTEPADQQGDGDSSGESSDPEAGGDGGDGESDAGGADAEDGDSSGAPFDDGGSSASDGGASSAQPEDESVDEEQADGGDSELQDSDEPGDGADDGQSSGGSGDADSGDSSDAGGEAGDAAPDNGGGGSGDQRGEPEPGAEGESSESSEPGDSIGDSAGDEGRDSRDSEGSESDESGPEEESSEGPESSEGSEPAEDEEVMDRGGHSSGLTDEGDETEVIDSGADDGEGGETQREADYGTHENVLRDFKVFTGHDDMLVQPESRDEVADDKAVDSAIVQGLYFEKPSVNVRGVREHKYGIPYMEADEHGFLNNMSTAWEDIWGNYFGMRNGVNADLDIPETILGPALIQMRRTFEDNARAAYQRNLRSGRVNSRVLGKRAPFKDDRLFAKKRLPGKRSYAALLGIDISGSTIGVNLALAKRAAMAQATLLDRMGIDFAIYAHTANGSSGPTSHGGYKVDDIMLDVYQIKGFEEPWAPLQKEALNKISSAFENLDGHGVEYYRKVIEKVDATDKLIFYYTDGKMPAANYDEELEILQREIAYCKQHKITLLGVGIHTDSPRRHGLDTVEVNKDEDISAVVRHLQASILHNR